MKLGELKGSPGAVRPRKRVGRGTGSGHGKTSCKGHKGQNARSGSKHYAWFEGGQMPLQRRVPKRGFKPLVRKEFAVVNVGALDAFEDGARVDCAALQTAGLVRKVGDGVKLLGEGDVSRKLHLVVHAYSQSAREKVEKAGGSVRLVTEEEAPAA